MFNILCFGDSNAFGANPSGGRWPGILQERLGSRFYVIEEGLGGRTAAAEDVLEGDKNGRLYLDAASAAGPSSLDQLHMEASGHRALADAVETVIRKHL